MKNNKTKSLKARARGGVNLGPTTVSNILPEWTVKLPRQDVERKYIVTSNSNTAINSGLNISTSLVAQNTSNSGRIGNSIRVRSLQLRFTAFHNPLGNVGQNARVLIFVDTVNQALTTTVGNVLENVGTDAIIESPYNHINVIQAKQYDILYDTVVPVSLGGPSTIHFEIKRKCLIDVEYSGSGGTITDLKRNNIVVLVAGDSGAAGPTYRWTLKSEFTDQ